MFCAEKSLFFALLLFSLTQPVFADTLEQLGKAPFVSMDVWENHVDILLHNQPGIEALYIQDKQAYQIASQDCMNVCLMLKDSAQYFSAQLKEYLDLKKQAPEGHRSLPLLDMATKQAILEQMTSIVNSAKEKISLVTKEVEFLTTYRNELKLVYQGILSQGVTRAPDLEKGIDRLEKVFDDALEAKKKFLDAVFNLAHEAQEMVDLVQLSSDDA